MNIIFSTKHLNSIALFMLIVGTITGSSIYFFIEQLQFFRMALLFLIVITIIKFTKTKVSFSLPITLLILFYSIYFFWTTFVTLGNGMVRLNDYVNFFIIYLLVILLSIQLEMDREHFLKILYKTTLLMIFVIFIISIWEILTQHHLSVSTVNNYPAYLKFTPSSFFTNENDMMAVVTLMLLYIVGYYKKYNKPLGFLVYFLFVFSLLLGFITEARLAMIFIVLTFFLLVANGKNILKIILVILFAIGLSIPLLNHFKPDTLERLVSGLQLGGNSTGIRKYLYLDAIDSIELYKGVGVGINNSDKFYKTISDPRVEGIINPHNYLLEILINSGVIVFTLYILLNIYFFFLFLNLKKYFLIYMLFVYPVILMSSSSSIFIWYHYVFFLGLVGLSFQNQKQRIQKI